MTEQSRLEQLEERLARLERSIFPQPAPYPAFPSISIGPDQCAVCGLDWSKGSMGYLCPHTRCPVQPKAT